MPPKGKLPTSSPATPTPRPWRTSGEPAEPLEADRQAQLQHEGEEEGGVDEVAHILAPRGSSHVAESEAEIRLDGPAPRADAPADLEDAPRDRLENPLIGKRAG